MDLGGTWSNWIEEKSWNPPFEQMVVSASGVSLANKYHYYQKSEKDQNEYLKEKRLRSRRSYIDSDGGVCEVRVVRTPWQSWVSQFGKQCTSLLMKP